MRRFAFAVILPLSLAAVSAQGTEASTAGAYYGKQKVVYHINGEAGRDDRAYMMALTNVQNHINAVGRDNIDIKVVMHGDGVDLLRDAKDNMNLQAKVLNLKQQRVSFLICNNTLGGRKIDPDHDLYDVDSADIVPSGVAELSRLQMMGYTYIHP